MARAIALEGVPEVVAPETLSCGCPLTARFKIWATGEIVCANCFSRKAEAAVEPLPQFNGPFIDVTTFGDSAKRYIDASSGKLYMQRNINGTWIPLE